MINEERKYSPMFADFDNGPVSEEHEIDISALEKLVNHMSTIVLYRGDSYQGGSHL